MRKATKITLIVLGVLVAMVLVAIVAVPLVFRDRLVPTLRAELNKQVNAKVDFSEVDLTMLSSFPVLEVVVNDLVVDGLGAFEGERLAETKEFGVGVDVWALITDRTLNVTRFSITEPVVTLRVNDEGLANYDILKESSDDEPSDVRFRVERVVVKDGAVSYTSPGFSASMRQLEVDGSAAVDDNRYDIDANVTAKALSASGGGVTFVRDATAALDLKALVDASASQLTIERMHAQLNELSAEVAGTFGWSGDTTRVDLSLKSDENESIKALLSAIPFAYTRDFADVKANGSFSLAVTAKGVVGPGDDDLPAVAAKLSVHDGKIQYPGLPLPLSGVQLEASVEHPGGKLDNATIQVPKFSLQAGKSSAKGSFSASKLQSVPRVALNATGDVDLADVSKAIPVGGALAGTIKANIGLRGRINKVDELTGSIEAKGIDARFEDTPPLRVGVATIRLTQDATAIDALRVSSGQSDMEIRGTLAPVTTILFTDNPIRGKLDVRSNKIDLTQLLATEKEGKTSSGFVIPDNLDATLTLAAKTLSYDKLVLNNLRGSATVKSRRLRLDDVRAKGLGGEMRVDGTLHTPPDGAAEFDFEYALSRAKFTEAFNAVGVFQKLAPIMKHMTGTFSTEIAMKGKLGDELNPVMSSLDGKGFMATIDGALTDFAPLKMLAKKLPKIPSSLQLRRTRANFTVEDGAVNVKEFPIAVRGLKLVVGGKHGLDQQMKYSIKTTLPVKDLRNSSLAAKLNSLGVNVNQLTNIDVAAVITGTATDPSVSIDMDAPDVKGVLKAAVSDKLNEQKAKLKQKVSAEAEKLLAAARTQSEKIRAEAAQAATRVEQQGEARAKKLEASAGRNPLKKVAAQQSAKLVRNESARAASKLRSEADSRASKITERAEAQAAKLNAND